MATNRQKSARKEQYWKARIPAGATLAWEDNLREYRVYWQARIFAGGTPREAAEKAIVASRIVDSASKRVTKQSQ
jgi:hypothetical protein